MHESSKIRAYVASVNVSAVHEFSKTPQPVVRLMEGLGIEGDAHCGTTVKHRSRVRKNPDQPNLRQVHLIHSELFDEVARNGHLLAPGDMSASGQVVRRAGVMAVVRRSGDVRAGDPVTVVLPAFPHVPLACV